MHKYPPHFAVPEPRIGFLQEALRWWDRWLKGQDTGVEDDPDLRYYLMDGGVRPATWYEHRPPGRWIAMSRDPAEVPVQRLPFGHGRRLGDGGAELCEIISSTQSTGSAGGEYCAIWLGGPELPGDQRQDDSLSVCFDSDPVATDMDIVGAPAVRLRLRSDRPQGGQLAVRLCHVHPDGGASTRITWGGCSIWPIATVRRIRGRCRLGGKRSG